MSSRSGNANSRSTGGVGSLQGLLGKRDKLAIEAGDLNKYNSLNADVRDDRVEYNRIGYQQTACQHDGAGSTIMGWKSYRQG